ncbi:hypothetical protein AMTRI_Chr07g30930 [Amborella trichopoda]
MSRNNKTTLEYLQVQQQQALHFECSLLLAQDQKPLVLRQQVLARIGFVKNVRPSFFLVDIAHLPKAQSSELLYCSLSNLPSKNPTAGEKISICKHDYKQDNLGRYNCNRAPTISSVDDNKEMGTEFVHK